MGVGRGREKGRGKEGGRVKRGRGGEWVEGGGGGGETWGFSLS